MDKLVLSSQRLGWNKNVLPVALTANSKIRVENRGWRNMPEKNSSFST